MKPKFAFRIASCLAALLLISITSSAQDWTQRFPAHSPSARARAAMAQLGDFTVLFGGETDSGVPMSDTWLWDGNDWSKPVLGLLGTGIHPPARSEAAMAYHPDTGKVVMFGGITITGLELNDTWTLELVHSVNFSFYEWRQIDTSFTPPARAGARMEYDPISKTVILTGGNNDSGNLQDTWSFNPGGTKPSWTKISTANVVSPGRERFGLAKCGTVATNGFFNFNVSPTQLLLFGGEAFGTTEVGDTWMLSNGIPDGPPFDWQQQTPSPRPARRTSLGMAYYPTSNRVILYGGTDFQEFPNVVLTTFNDTWFGLCGGTASWTQANPAHNPGPRTEMGMATGPGGFTVVLFGGNDDEGHRSGQTWTWGRQVACVPANGSEIRVGSEVRCQFDAADGVVFGGWSASGFARPRQDGVASTFHTEGPGSAAITAHWSDASGFHSETLNYMIVTPNNNR